MNIRFGIFSFLLGIAVLTAVFFPPGAYGEEKVYVVRKGETFYSIAQTLGVKAEDLMKFNGITDPARLQAGQRLRIPGVVDAATVQGSAAGSAASGTGGQTNAAAGGNISYRVVRGDTFYSISRKFSVTENQIREANSLSNSYVLREGDSLVIPQKAGAGGTAGNPAVIAAPVPQNGTRKPETSPVSSQVTWPITARELSYMTGKLSGVVITGTRAESVKSLTWGTILSAGPYRGFGKVIIVQVEGGYLYVYGGCESLSVKEGDKVGPGTELGVLGLDAVSAKPQLFFMVYRSNSPIDPAKAPRA